MYQAKQCIANAIAAEGQISGAWSMPAAQRATQGILVLPKCLRLEHYYNLKKVETISALFFVFYLSMAACHFSQMYLQMEY